MKCSTVDCTCFISPLDPHVSTTHTIEIDVDILAFRFSKTIRSLFGALSISVFGISLFKVLTVIAFPVAVAKSGISLLHAYVAAQNISVIDMSEREEIRQRNAVKKPE